MRKRLLSCLVVICFALLCWIAASTQWGSEKQNLSVILPEQAIFIPEETEWDIGSVSFTEHTYECHDENYEVELSYPQIIGSGDKQKEERINRLIEEDVKKIVKSVKPYNDCKITAGIRGYEIKYVDDALLSIVYKGYAGTMMPGTGISEIMVTTTINFKEEKVLELGDVVSDFNGLCKLLMEDCFEDITTWDGESGQYPISELYYWNGAGGLWKDLMGTGEDDCIEWYTDGKNFVIVVQGRGADYNEYSIDIKQLREILREEFLEEVLSEGNYDEPDSDTQQEQAISIQEETESNNVPEEIESSNVSEETEPDKRSVSFIECTYECYNESYEVELSYPQIVGSEDKQKEERINRLIEEDVKKKMVESVIPYNDCIVTAGMRGYEIKYADDALISIAYKGYAGIIMPGTGIPEIMATTTINVEEERILELKDVVSDFDGLCKLLMEDCFEDITTWDGESGQYPISELYYWNGAGGLLENLMGTGEEDCIEWYTDGKNFVIVVQGQGADYNEYSIDIEQLREILQEEFLEIWGK